MPAVGRTRFAEVLIDLREIPRDVRKDLRPALKKAGDAVLSDAKNRASWSSRIPGSLRIAVLYGRKAGVVIKANRKRAPHARAYEGIGARKGSATEFRHPVFGRDKWVSQKTKPFLHPAAQAKRAEVRRAVEDVVVAAARRHGFK